MSVEKLYPEKVFSYFSEISKIPRGSKKEKQISDWLVKFAKDRKLEVLQDDYHNVLIRKAATKGYEDYSPLIIQGHMDMVWEKNKDTKFDFATQPIELLVEDGFLTANGTTLGADNGIAVAYALAILDSDDIKHPDLEVIITSDEEDGMSGVNNLDYSIFDGKTLINLDTEEYGQVYVSSAGGARTSTQFIFETKKAEEGEYTYLKIEVKGLSGGHSGAEIHKNLGNSNKILSEVLYHLSKKYTLSLIHIDGGDKVNAIPREADIKIGIKLENDTVDDLKKLAELAFENILKDFKVVDKSPVLIVEKFTLEEESLRISSSNTLNVISFLHEIPNGVLKMSEHIEGLVETSINPGVVKTEILDGSMKIVVQTLPRSSVNSSLEKLINEITELSRNHGANIKIDSSYPSWEYRENSAIRDLIVKSFKEVTGKDPKVKAIHAGLECGIFSDNIENLDVVSIGPNIQGAHTPQERMEIESVGKTWELLLKVLENYNIKSE